MQEYRTNKEPKKEQYSFSEYHPIILSKDNLSQIIFVIFGVEADSIDNISSRMLEDKAVIRTKYNLPPAPLLTENPKEYLRMLISIAQQQKIDIRKKEEFIQFFKERFASAVYLHEPNAIVTEETQDSDNLSSLIEKIHSFEHELVHGLQKIKYPGLSQTRKEYEAYLAANISENTIQNSPFVVFERIALSLTPDKLSEEFKGRAGSVA